MTQTVIWGNPTSQWGEGNGPAGIWTTLAFTDGVSVLLDGTAGILRHVGFVFDASLDQTFKLAPDGRIVDGPNVTGVTLQVTMSEPTAFEGGGPDTRVEWLLVPDETPANYASGDGFAPTFRDEVSLGTQTLTLNPFPATTTVSFPVTGDALLQVRARVTQSARWTGRLAISLRGLGANTLRVSNGPTMPATLTTTQELFFLGMTGGPDGKVRAVRDGRYGMPAWNTELVRDGDNPGLWVRPWDSDPEDEAATYRPKPGEGTVDDEIGNL